MNDFPVQSVESIRALILGGLESALGRPVSDEQRTLVDTIAARQHELYVDIAALMQAIFNAVERNPVGEGA